MSNADFFPIERNRYFYGKLLTVRDFEIEQRYNRSKSQLLNRLRFGAGVVCGLGVAASDDTTLLIESGMALDYQGRMIVLEEAMLRKLQMLDGQEELLGKDTGYLCLTYDETDIEPVNAVGADTGESRQFNMTREGFRVYLTAQPPEYQSLLEASGRENVTVLYSSSELTLVLSTPANVCGGQEFEVQMLVVKMKRPRRCISVWMEKVRLSIAKTAAFAWSSAKVRRKNDVSMLLRSSSRRGSCAIWTANCFPRVVSWIWNWAATAIRITLKCRPESICAAIRPIWMPVSVQRTTSAAV